MNPIKTIAFGLMAILSLAHSVAAYSAGTIILLTKDNRVCPINIPEPGKTVTIGLTNVPGCGDFNNYTRSFKLAEVPSATQIVFFTDGYCDYNNPAWFRIKTINKLTTSSIIETQHAMTFRPGQIMEPGLLMEDRLEGGGVFLDRLSCLIIKASAAPPSSSPSPVTTP